MRFLLLSVFFFLLPVTVSADESLWVEHSDVAKSRIISAEGHANAQGSGWFAWELRLQQGWKVYWRSPGEAGLPPILKLKAGSTAKSLTSYFPLPKRFELFGMQTYGYGNIFVLPFKAEGGVANQPSVLDMTVDFMICKEVCIPFTSAYHLSQSGDDSAQTVLNSATISLWRAKIPDVSGEAVAGLKITSVAVKGSVGHQNLIFEVEADKNLSRADILIESDEVFTFGKPKINIKGKKASMIVSVDGGRKSVDIKGRKATVTFTDGRGNAIERKMEIR